MRIPLSSQQRILADQAAAQDTWGVRVFLMQVFLKLGSRLSYIRVEHKRSGDELE